MTGDEMLRNIQRVLASSPPNPVAPENRRLSRLQSSSWIECGRVFRIKADISEQPLIVMHPDDIAAVVKASGPWPPHVDVGQEIADCAEQMFAQQEADEK